MTVARTVIVKAARGDNFADVARRTGAYGVTPNDTDADVLEKLADWAIVENPGFKGDKGDPGGNVMAIGLFADAGGMAISAGADAVRTAGHTVEGIGIADYVYDAAVDAAYVAAHPQTSFLAADGRGFRLVFSGEAHVDAFGALGDGSDESVAVQAAMTATTGRLNFRDGATYIAQGLVPHDNLTLAGAATIRPPVSQTDHVIHYNSATTLYDFNIEGLTFLGRGTSTYDAIHITSPTPEAISQNWNESTLSRLDISQFRNGIFCPTPRSVRLRDCYIWGNANGIAWDWEHFYLDHCTVMFNGVGLYVGHGSPVGTGIHHFRIIGTPIAHNTVAGIKGNMSSGSIIACSLIDNGSDPDPAAGHGHIVGEGVLSNMRIIGNRLEKGPATPFGIVNVAPGSLAVRNLIQANTFISNAVADLYGSFAQCSVVGNLSRLCGGNFYVNTGGSTADMIFTGNQVSDCAKEAMVLSGTMIAMDISGNAITNAGISGAAGTYSAIRLATGASLNQASISRNTVRNTTGTKYTQHAVDLTAATVLSSVKVRDNTCRNLNATAINTTATALSDGLVVIDSNDGTVSENTGVATIVAGDTFVDVGHGLAYTPSATRISVNPATPVAYAVPPGNITATHFRVSIAAAAGANITFNWSARLKK